MPLNFQSIAVQLAQALRAEISSRAWNRVLPSERQLAERFQVSRKTVRKALAELRAEGVLQTERSRGSVIAARRGRRRESSLRIALLLPEPLEGSRPFTALWVNRLMTLLQEIGHPLQIFHGTKYYGANAARSLARLTAAHPARCWIVARSNRPLQEWFAASDVPALICGSAHPGVALPSVDVDHRALCRHSAALFLRHGHRRLALFLEPGGHGGDFESEQGFREGLAATPGALEPVIYSPQRSSPSVIRELRRLLALKQPPTGLLLSNSYSYLTVHGYLASLGLRVPRDISVVLRDEETFLRFMHPAPTYYSTRPAKFAQVLHQALKRILAGDRSAFSIRIMPDLVPGDSVGPARSWPSRCR
jgi:DNA-binding LacI/PurR family transcriptional regulator